MHNETSKALYEALSLEDKNDFFPAYLYLKYIDHFMSKVLQSLGMPTTELPFELGADLDAMMEAYVQEVSEAAPSADTSIYHAKVIKLKDALQLVTQKADVELDISEKVIPFKVAKDILLHNPDSIAIGRCPCRAAAEKSCLPPPMEVCFFVGDPIASFIGDQNESFRPCTQEEAVRVLEESHKNGFVQTAWFKKELGNSFHMICNCCSCCCMGIKMWNLLEGTVPIMAPSGYVAEVGDDCSGCATCVDEHACHFNAITMSEEGDKAVINFDKCMGCGVCEDVCPDRAIRLRREPAKGEPLDLAELMGQ